MQYHRGLSLGIFLVALGVGWIVLATASVGFEVFPWILVAGGVGIVVSALLSWWRPNTQARSLITPLLGGIVIALLLTAGTDFLQGIGGGTWPYRAEATSSFSATVATGKVYFEVDNINGLVEVATWTKAEYKISATIVARGSSPSDANATLTTLKVNIQESQNQDQNNLVLKYDAPFLASLRYAIDVEAVLPQNVVTSLKVGSTNGGITLQNLTGGTLDLSTSNGPIVLANVVADTMSAVTSNGRVEGSIVAKDSTVTTSNGRIELKLPSTVSGSYILKTSNGRIDLVVSPSPQAGYNLDLSTSNADISISLSNLEYSLDQRTAKKAQTTAFDLKAIQIAIVAQTSNAGIDVDIS